MLLGTSAIIRGLVAPSTETVIDARTPASFYWRELWAYRELLRILAWRDLTVRYRQAALGVLWAVGRPLLMAAIFSLVFGVIARLPTGGSPYLLVVLSALLVWQLFAGTVLDASQSLVSNAALVTKVYFPRALAPAGAAAASLVDAAIALGLLVLIAAGHGIFPGFLRLLALLLVLAVTMVFALGVGLWLSALNVRYRDVRIVLPFALQVGIYVSPVGFASQVVPERWRDLYALNPLVGLIDASRWALLGTASPEPVALASSGLWAVFALASGFAYFRRAERSFADVI